MKNVGLVLILITVGIFSSCSDSEENIELDQSSQLDSVELQIEKAYEMFILAKESNPNAVLQFSMQGDKLISKIEVLSNERFSQEASSFSADKPLCKGDGLKFARCVKKNLDILGCVVIKTCVYCAFEC